MPLPRHPRFHDEAAAFAHVEGIRWPDGPVCPHCGEEERIYALEGVRGQGGTIRQGLRKCGACRRQFTVRSGTAFERSHVPLHKWLAAIELVREAGAGANAHRLMRTLDVTYRTAAAILDRLATLPDPIPVRPRRRPDLRPIFVTGDGTFPLAPAPAGWWPAWGAARPAAEMVFFG